MEPKSKCARQSAEECERFMRASTLSSLWPVRDRCVTDIIHLFILVLLFSLSQIRITGHHNHPLFLSVCLCLSVCLLLMLYLSIAFYHNISL